MDEVMKESDLELLSRILDENVSEFETNRILKEIQSAPEARAILQRYNLIGHAMRKELPAQHNKNFVNQVMQKVSDDVPTDDKDADYIDAAERHRQPNKIKTVVGLAIAASVAIFSFVTFQNFLQPKTEDQPTPVVAERVVKERDIQRVSAEELQNFVSNPDAEAEFNSYIVNHAEYASPRVSVPYVRIVGYGYDHSKSEK